MGIINAKTQGNYSEEQIWRQRLEQIFISLSKTKNIYDQIRYIDKFGMECVRVDLKEGIPVAIPETKLQNKRSRYYFLESINLNADEIYISPVDLNKEKGVIVRPFKPMVRIAVPVITSDGRREGIIILNILIQKALHIPSLLKPNNLKEGFWYVADGQGYYLHNGVEPQKEWGGPNDLKTGEGLHKDFPDIYGDLMEGHHSVTKFKGTKWYVFSQIDNLFADSSQQLIIGQAIPKLVLMRKIYKHIIIIALIAVIIIILTIYRFFSGSS